LLRGLEREGYAVDLATNGRDALAWGLANPYSGVVLDVVIPAPDGLTVVRRLRQAGRLMPVIMLTARDRVEDRIAGLAAGADDYLCKPFSMRELTSRLHALDRRAHATAGSPTALVAGDLTIDRASRRVVHDATPVELSSREFDLLTELMRHPDCPLSRTFLLEHVWGPEYRGNPGVLEFYVERLRDRIDRRFGHVHLESVEGPGYRLRT